MNKKWIKKKKKKMMKNPKMDYLKMNQKSKQEQKSKIEQNIQKWIFTFLF